MLPHSPEECVGILMNSSVTAFVVADPSRTRSVLTRSIPEVDPAFLALPQINSRCSNSSSFLSADVLHRFCPTDNVRFFQSTPVTLPSIIRPGNFSFLIAPICQTFHTSKIILFLLLNKLLNREVLNIHF